MEFEDVLNLDCSTFELGEEFTLVRTPFVDADDMSIFFIVYRHSEWTILTDIRYTDFRFAIKEIYDWHKLESVGRIMKRYGLEFGPYKQVESSSTKNHRIDEVVRNYIQGLVALESLVTALGKSEVKENQIKKEMIGFATLETKSN